MPPSPVRNHATAEIDVGTLVAFEFTQPRRRDMSESGNPDERDTCWRWSVGSVLRINPHARLVTLGVWDPPRRDDFSGEDERTAFELERAIFRDEELLRVRREELEGMIRAAGDRAKVIKARSKETSEQLDAVRPGLEEAKQALNSISTDHMRELRSYTTPPEMVRKVLDAVTVLIGTPTDSWSAMRAIIRSDDLIPTIRDFQPEKVHPAALAAVEKSLQDKAFTFERCARASKAAGPMFLWVEAQVKYARVWLAMAPLVEELEEHKRKLLEMEEQKTTALVEAHNLEAQLKALRQKQQTLLYGSEHESSLESSEIGHGIDPLRSRHGKWLQRVDGREQHLVILKSSIMRVLAKGRPQHGSYLLTEQEAPHATESAESSEAALQRRIDGLEAELADTNRRLKRAETQISAVEAEAAGSSQSAAARVAELEETVADLREQLHAADEDAARAARDHKSQHANLAMRVEVLERELQLAAERDKELCRKHHLELVAAEDALHDANTALAGLELEVDDARSARDRVVDERNKLYHDVEDLQLKLEEARSQVVVAEKAFEAVQLQVSRHRDPLASGLGAGGGGGGGAATGGGSGPSSQPASERNSRNASRSHSRRASHVHAVLVEDRATQTDDVFGGACIDDDRDDDVSTNVTPQHAPAAAPSGNATPVDDEEADDLDFDEDEDHDGDDEDDMGHLVPHRMHYLDISRSTYFVCVFPVDKVVQSKFPGGRKLRRSWVLDFFRQQVHNCGGDGKISKSFDIKNLAMIERSESQPQCLRLLFNGVGHDHTLLFLSPHARERFVELVHFLRPGVVTYCPEFMPPEPARRARTTISTNGANELEVEVVGGKITAGGGGPGKELLVDVSRGLFEVFNIWIGTHNLDNSPASTDSSLLDNWLPRAAADIYVVALQNTHGDPHDTYDVLKTHLGAGVFLASSVEFQGTGMALFVRRSALIKVSNCEGAKATIDDEGHGALALSFHVLDTRVCVISASLPHVATIAKRTALLRESVRQLSVGMPDSDITCSASHVFLTGELAYSLVCDQTELSRSVCDRDYDRLLRSEGFTMMRKTAPSRPFAAFQEHPIAFPPTAFTEKGAGYFSRVLHFSLGVPYANVAGFRDTAVVPASPAMKCVAYGAAEEMVVSPYLAVAAMYKMHARRSAVAAFTEEHVPTFRLTITQVAVTVHFAKDDEPEVRNPCMRLHSPIGGSVLRYSRAGAVGSDGSGYRFTPTDAARTALEITTHVQAVIDSELVIMTLLDDAAPAGFKAVATAALPLRGRVGPDTSPANKPTSFTVPLIRSGGVVGMAVGQCFWEPSKMSLMETIM